MLRHDYSWTEVALGLGASLLLAVMAVASLGLRYVTRPITCWVPAQFEDQHINYAHDLCFQQEEIMHSFPNDIHTSASQFDPRWQFTFHHWVPFALGIGALICLIPHLAWRMLSALLWMDIHPLLSTLADNQRQAAERRHVMLRDTAIVLQAGLRRGNMFLTLAALGRKVLVCITCLVQLLLVVIIFRPQLSVKPAQDNVSDGDSQDDDNDEETAAENDSLPLPFGPFPCLFTIRQIQTLHDYTVQCILPLNQVYSKGFTFLFYFFLLLAVVCTLDLLVWVGRVIIPGLRDAAVQRYLDAVAGNESGGGVSQLYTRFSESLGWDGRLVLALTADYCGPVAAADLTNHLWVIFKGSPRPSVPPPASDPPVMVGAASSRARDGGDPATIPLVPVGGDAAHSAGDTSAAKTV